MNQKTKNHDSVVRSEFYHFIQRNYPNMIALFYVRNSPCCCEWKCRLCHSPWPCGMPHAEQSTFT